MKKLLTILVLAITMIAFTCCGKEDFSPKEFKEYVIGIWQVQTSGSIPVTEFFVFNANGTYTYDSKTDPEAGTWTCSVMNEKTATITISSGIWHWPNWKQYKTTGGNGQEMIAAFTYRGKTIATPWTIVMIKQ